MKPVEIYQIPHIYTTLTLSVDGSLDFTEKQTLFPFYLIIEVYTLPRISVMVLKPHFVHTRALGHYALEDKEIPQPFTGAGDTL